MKTKLTKTQAKKLVATRNRQINKENKLFQSLTPAQKRVYIARDVLKHLDSEQLIARTGVWLEQGDPNKNFLFKLNGDRTKKDNDTEVRDILNKQNKCEGCALGGMFMCAVKVANKLKLGQMVGDDGGVSESDTFHYMRRFFSFDQLELIESAFEAGEGGATGTEDSRTYFGDDPEGYSDPANEVEPEVRMRMIMQNIIKHKGKFDPKDRPVRQYAIEGFQE